MFHPTIDWYDLNMDVHFVESHRLKAIFEDVRALKGKLEKVLSSDMRSLKTEVENAVQTMNTWETNWSGSLYKLSPVPQTVATACTHFMRRVEQKHTVHT